MSNFLHQPRLFFSVLLLWLLLSRFSLQLQYQQLSHSPLVITHSLQLPTIITLFSHFNYVLHLFPEARPCCLTSFSTGVCTAANKVTVRPDLQVYHRQGSWFFLLLLLQSSASHFTKLFWGVTPRQATTQSCCLAFVSGTPKHIFCTSARTVSVYCCSLPGLSPGCSLTATVINDDRPPRRSFITWQCFNLFIGPDQCQKRGVWERESERERQGKRERSWRNSFFAIKIIKARSQIANTCPRYLFWIVCELRIADSFPRNRSLRFHFVLSPALSLHPSSNYVGFFFGPKIKRTQMSAVLYWCF